ncbi:MAG: hypothetical protein A2158_04640 [Chloroflexi bacterium RBG_13_46_14]|nr:MAG: hypothetical protein A2158_04640 [Chloroflexi bacterium RBG_13_46_14]
MANNDKIDALERKLEKWRAEDIKQEKKSRYENGGYVSWGFAVGALGLALAMDNDYFMYICSVLFFIIGWYSNYKSRKVS